MHVYLRDEQVRIRMEQVDAQGLAPADTELIPMAFFADDNEVPSFRALLPPDTIEVLQDAFGEPVTLGVLAEEPEDAGTEIRAMVGLAVPIGQGDHADEGEEEASEAWRASIGDVDAWRGEDSEDFDDTAVPRTALLAFAPLVRITRRHPEDFGEELADLLESALAGVTRPALEARIDRMLEDM